MNGPRNELIKDNETDELNLQIEELEDRIAPNPPDNIK